MQVTKDSVLLLKGSELLQTVQIDLGSDLVTASCADPNLAVMASNGEVAVLELEGDKLSIIKNKIEGSNSPFLAISLYKDMSGLLTSDSKSSSKEKKSKQNNSKTEDDVEVLHNNLNSICDWQKATTCNESWDVLIAKAGK